VKRVEAPCPSCGAPVEFKTASALVTICPFCHSAVARGDRRLEDWGKVAALAPTGSSFEIGMTGRHGDRPFEIVGHVQYEHAAGGFWDEWYAAFADGRWGWIAEAQGRIYLTFEQEARNVPAFDSLTAGERLDLGSGGQWKVAEVGRATTRGAEGEMPYAFTPGKPHDFADLVGPQGRFVTLDYSGDAPRLFVGEQVTLEQLGISAAAVARAIDDAGPVEIGAQQVACPNCGGSLDLKAPDQTLRVACPYCSALLDCDQGNLKYLSTLDQEKPESNIRIGRTGELFGVNYIVIGFVRRAVTFDREYTWDEYLLFDRPTGFRWLVHSDGHWSFVQPLTLGDIERHGKTIAYSGRTFKVFQTANATVKQVLGEFYWKIAVGETVFAEDFIDPPDMITIETSYRQRINRGEAEAAAEAIEMMRSNRLIEKNEMASEVNLSLGTYVPHATVEQAFGLPPLSRGWGVAPNQPAPGPTSIYKYWGLFAASLLIIHFVIAAVSSKPVDHWIAFWAIAFVSLMPVGTMLYNHSFERSRWQDSEYNPYASSDEGGGDEDHDAGWLGDDGDD
jgi:hypothetical protein